MNSRNLSRFHKFSGSNFKKKIIEIKIQLQSFLHSSHIQIEKRIIKNKNKENKFYSKLYTEFLSFPLFLGSEDESYFTILILSIYKLSKEIRPNPQKKTPGGILKRKAQITVSGHDLRLISRPQFPLFVPVQLRLGFFSCDQDSCRFVD